MRSATASLLAKQQLKAQSFCQTVELIDLYFAHERRRTTLGTSAQGYGIKLGWNLLCHKTCQLYWRDSGVSK